MYGNLFPRICLFDGFCWIFRWLENPYISHVMKSTVGWECNWKKATTLWEKYEGQFLRSSPYDGFCWIFSYYGKLMGKPMHFLCNEVYRRMGIEWEKSTPPMGKVWFTNFPGFPHTMGFVAFSHAIGNWWENPCISHMMKYTIGWESDGKKLPILRDKYDYQFPMFSPYDGFCCMFPCYEKLMGKPKHFPYDETG